MTGPQTRTMVQELLARHGISPAKRLGQNFLVDPNIVAKIVGLVDAPPGTRVVEIGPGTGTLTAALARAGFRVLAYEIDEALRPVLEETLKGLEGIEIRFEDATDVSLDSELEDGPWWLVSNLPYNVGTGLLLDALRWAPRITGFVVMVQREVADRLTAPVGSHDYGVPSVVARLFGTPSLAFRVPPQVFIPRPNVDSAVVTIRRSAEPAGAAHQRAVGLAQAAFGQRRKMLRSSLRAALADPDTTLAAAGIDPRSRAEQLEPADFLRLAEVAP